MGIIGELYVHAPLKFPNDFEVVRTISAKENEDKYNVQYERRRFGYEGC